MKKPLNVAIVGATGNVGRAIIKILEERNFPIRNIHAIASDTSIGKKVSFGMVREIVVEGLNNFDFSKVDMVFMCAGSKISKEYSKKISDLGVRVIDKSSYNRMDSNVPLIVPEVNLNSLDANKHKIVASPNCIATPLAVALNPLDNAVKIKRLVIATYQSVSGKGKKAMDELYGQTKAKYTFKEYPPKIFEKNIAFNIIPKIGDLNDNGISEEEEKIEEEFSKIMGRNIPISVTCVRIPTFIGHAISVNIEFEASISAQEAIEILEEADGVVIAEGNNGITPIEAAGEDAVFISRIRNDISRRNCLNLWTVTDNLLKGAALNAVQIAEHMLT